MVRWPSGRGSISPRSPLRRGNVKNQKDPPEPSGGSLYARYFAQGLFDVVVVIGHILRGDAQLLCADCADEVADRLHNRVERIGMYEALCKRRGFILKGGEYDYDRGAKALIDDFRKGRIGKVCLEDAAEYRDLSF